MSDEKENLETFLQVGAPVLFYSDTLIKHAPRYHTVVRGWQRGTHVLLDRPRTANGLFTSIQEGQKCCVRFINEGLACSFDSQVIDWDTRRFHPFMRVRWPKEIAHFSFRKHERVKMHLTASVRVSPDTVLTGDLLDLSLGGCRLRVPQFFGAGEQMVLGFTLPNGGSVEGLGITVRTGAEHNGVFVLGCAFNDGQETLVSDVAFYVMTVLDHRRESGMPMGQSGRVLLLEAREDVRKELMSALENEGFYVVTAQSAVEGVYRLRAARPVAAVIGEELPGIAGSALCRMIRLTPEYEELPIFLMGDKGADSGATGVFPVHKGIAQEIGRAIKKSVERGMA